MVYNSLEASDSNTPQQTTYNFVLHEPDVCYLAVTDGEGGAVIINYNPNASDCSNYTSGEIPSNVAVAPITAGFNKAKCNAYMDEYMHQASNNSSYISSGGGSSASDFCDMMESFIPSEITPDMYAEVPFSQFFDAEMGSDWAFYPASLDIDIGTPSGSYPVTKISDYAFYEKNITSITIPSSVTYIGENAFKYNKLTSITIPSGVTTIKEDSFKYNNLTSITIPSSVTTIEDNSFAYNNLTSITIPNSVTYIGEEAFYANNLTSVKIPDSVTEIDYEAFRYNQLTSVEIGSGIQSIHSYAFGDGQNMYNDINYGPNQLTSVIIHVPNASSLTSDYQFGWASGYSNSNIVWDD